MILYEDYGTNYQHFENIYRGLPVVYHRFHTIHQKEKRIVKIYHGLPEVYHGLPLFLRGNFNEENDIIKAHF